MITAQRYHDISCGHRVHGHESKCQYLHGHNYRIHFKCVANGEPVTVYPEAGLIPPAFAGLDSIGRVIDFGVIKSRLCMWVEENWDHKFLAWDSDEIMQRVVDRAAPHGIIDKSVVWVPFNPTAENMALYLLKVVGPEQLKGTGVNLTEVIVEETAKCSATAVDF